jgi:tetratricopeptide (TPR) repeat protein
MKRVLVTIRWIVASALFYACFRAIRYALTLSDFSAVGPLILGFAALLSGILFISPEIVVPICEWISRFFTNLILPNDEFSKPALSYILARRYAQQMRYSEALEQYRTILRYYPNERDAYRELICLCAISGQNALASYYIKRFQKMFPNESIESLPSQASKETY